MLETPPFRNNHINDTAPPSTRANIQDNNEVFNRYQREVNMGKSQAVKTMDKKVITKFIRYFNKPFKDVTLDDVMGYFDKMYNGEIKTCRNTNYNPYTIEQHKSQLKKFFKWFYSWEEGQALPSPVKKLKVFAKKTVADILTDKEKVKGRLDSPHYLKQLAWLYIVMKVYA